jgi:adenine-specific DNA-methyltransferase
MLSQVRSVLGRPFYEAGDVLIYNMDCLAGMRLLNPGFVDLTVTSPPYNIGKEYETIKPLDDYLCWCDEWIAEVYRLTSQHGAFWLNLGYLELDGRAKAIPIAYLLWDRIPFYLIQEVVWHYEAGVAAKRMLSPRNEKFLWYVRSTDNYIFNLDSIRDPDVNITAADRKTSQRIRFSGAAEKADAAIPSRLSLRPTAAVILSIHTKKRMVN